MISVDFQVIPRHIFLHKNNTMEILLKTTSVRVSSIQIMQVRVQNKGKRVWKSRYDGDVSVFYSTKKKSKLESRSTYIIESGKMILEFGEAFGEALKIAKKKNNMV